MRKLAALAATGVAVLAAACGGTQYTYVKSSSEGAYLRLPGSWKTYDEGEFWNGAPQPLSEEQLDALTEGTWTVAFDAAPDPSLDHVYALSPDHPTGLARVYPVSSEERDVLSLRYLRALLGDIETQVEEGSAEILDYEELTLEGFLGSRFVVQLDTEDGPVVFHQTAFFDSDATKIYSLTMSCSADCYERSAGEMDEVADTWTLRKK